MMSCLQLRGLWPVARHNSARLPLSPLACLQDALLGCEPCFLACADLPTTKLRPATRVAVAASTAQPVQDA